MLGQLQAVSNWHHRKPRGAGEAPLQGMRFEDRGNALLTEALKIEWCFVVMATTHRAC